MRLQKYIVTALLCVPALAAYAQNDYVAGTHYLAVEPAQETGTVDRIEVVEMFWYGCPHCFDFESYIGEWLATKAADVEFVRIPAVFSQSWEPHARAFYTAETLGVLEKIHRPLFNAIHRENQLLNSEDTLARFFARYGVEDADFRKTYRSFGVDGKVARSRQLSRSYGITGVPAVIVNGKYRSSASAAGSYPDLLKLVNQLVDTERENGSTSVSR